jgi:hypothetical protein
VKPDNHYEVAFEAFLRAHGVAALPIVEARRSYLDDDSVKSPDFLVISAADARLVVDVKGRKFGGSPEKPRRIWQNWCQRDDVASLERWTAHFGPGFRGVFAFVYHLAPEIAVAPGTPDVFVFRDALYLVRGIEVTDYRAAMRTRSPRWDTVHLPTADFREVVKPFSHFLGRVNHKDTKDTKEEQGDSAKSANSTVAPLR